MEIKKDITLSKWFACFNTNKNFPDNNIHEYCDYGPLRIYKNDDNCNIYSFGHENKNIIIFDGFIYDDENLMPGHEPLSNKCSELASIYYEKYGEKVFEKLKGKYLLAIWDNCIQTLLLGRDGIGRHPLYYSVVNKKLFFSSNLLSLSSSGYIDKKPDRLSLSMLILGWWPENESTSFEKIKKLIPGNFIKINSGMNLNKIFYFDSMPDDDEPYLDEETSIEKFEDVILNAIDKCMMLKPQGVMLSGGIDSMVVTALANKRLGKYNLDKLVACSGRMLPEDALEYEELMQDKITQLYSMNHIKSNMRDWIGDKELIECSLTEISNFSYPTNYYWSGGFMNFWRDLSSKNLQRLLTGSGGDELLGLHPAYSADLLKSFKLKKLSDYIKSEVAGGKSYKDVLRVSILTHGIKLIIGSYWKKYFPVSKTNFNKERILGDIPDWLITDSTIKNDLVELIYRRRIPETLPNNKAPKDYYRHALRSSNKNGFLDYEAECNYHNTQLAGVSFMSPYQDIDAIKFFLRVKPEMFMFGKRYKGLLRTLSSKHLPGFDLENQKKLYPSLELNYGIKSMSDNTKKLFKSSKLSHVDNFGIVMKNHLKKCYNKKNQLSFNDNYQLYGILCVDKWLSTNV